MKIRPSALAGTWYPSHPKELKLSVEIFLTTTRSRERPELPSTPQGKLRALVLPHAGHRYSGRTCAAGIHRLRGEPVSKIILIGPSHRTFIRGAALPSATHFETPLGAVPIDPAAVQQLSASGIPVSDTPHAKEHCLEILLPFFQVMLNSFQIVPLLVGSLSESERSFLADRLRSIMDDRTLLVASSDFVHYGEDFDYVPDVGPDVRLGVRKIDDGAIERIRSMDAAGLVEYRRQTGATICGIAPISVLLDILPKNTRVEFVDYSQSADITGDTDHMVSYAAVAFYDP